MMLSQVRLRSLDGLNALGPEVVPIEVTQVACHVNSELLPQPSEGAAGATAVEIQSVHHVSSTLIKRNRAKGHGLKGRGVQA